MECWQCGETVRPGSKRCAYCGAQLTGRDGERNAPSRLPRTPFAPKMDWNKAPSAPPPSDDDWSRSWADGASDQDGDWDSSQAGGGNDWDASGSEEVDVPQPPARRPQRPPQPDLPDPLEDPRAPRSLRRQSPSRPAQPNGVSNAGWDDMAGPGAGPRGGRVPQRSSVPGPSSRGGAGRPTPGGGRSSDGYVGGARPGGREILPPLTQEHDRVGGQPDYGYPGEESYPAPNRPGSRRPSSGGSPARDRGYDRGFDESAVGWGENAASWDESAAGWDESASYELPQRGRGPASRDRQGAYGGQQAGGWDESVGGFRIPADAPEDQERTRKSRRALTIILSLVLIPIIVVPIVLFGPQLASRLTGQGQQAALSTPLPFATYTPGPTPTLVPSYKLFTSQQAGYLLAYPQLWTVRSDDKTGGGPDHIDTFQSTTTASVYSVEQSSTFNSYSNDDILNGEVHSAEQSGATFTSVPGTAASQVIGGENWLRHEYTVSYQGKALHMVILVCHHLGKGYVIVVSTLDKDYSSESQKYFTPMLQSFRFAN